jgi:hypothetical protein
MQADQELDKMGRRRPQIPSSLSIHSQHQPSNTDSSNSKPQRKVETSSRQQHLPLVGGVLAVPKRARVQSKKKISSGKSTPLLDPGSTSVGRVSTQERSSNDSDRELNGNPGNEEGIESGDGYSEDSFDDLDDVFEGDGTSEKGPEYNEENGEDGAVVSNGFGGDQTIRPGSRRSEALVSLERDCAARMIQLSFLQYKHIKKSKQRRTRRGESQAEELRVLRDE